MKRPAVVMCVSLALQPTFALSAEPTIQPGARERNSPPSFEIQRGRGASRDLAKNCITFHPVDPNGVAPQGTSTKPTATQGSVDPRNRCDPMTEPAHSPDRRRLVHTFADGIRLYVVTYGSGIQQYLAIDQRGRALKAEEIHERAPGLVQNQAETLEPDRQRARNAQRDEPATGAAVRTGKRANSWVRVVAADGGVHRFDTACLTKTASRVAQSQ